LPLTWSLLNEEQRLKTLQLGENVFLKRWQQWKESETYNRYLYWNKFNGKDVFENPKLAEYFDFNGEMNWQTLEEFFKQITHESEINLQLPWSINLGGKRDLKIHYPYNQDPYVEAPIQDFYGLKETPKIAQNKILLTIRLIGPHKRPLQVTKDLSGFWRKTYLEMLKEFKRDYPRHHWPDDPVTAKPILLKRQLNEN
jgi:HrpA-like RNA helicase